EDAKADFELTPVGSSETMDILASQASITEAGSSVLGAVIENKQITQLPLNGRNFLQLGSLVANVTATASLRSAAEGGIRNGPFAVAGQRDRSLTFLVDGLDNSNTLSDADFESLHRRNRRIQDDHQPGFGGVWFSFRGPDQYHHPSRIQPVSCVGIRVLQG